MKKGTVFVLHWKSLKTVPFFIGGFAGNGRKQFLFFIKSKFILL